VRALLALIVLMAPWPARACGLELVLAMDVSRSVINAEYDLQKGGLARAFRDAEVIEAIGWTPGGIAVTVMEWSGADAQVQTVGWRLLGDPVSVRAFAAEIDATRRQFFRAFTAVGEALFHANSLSGSNPFGCARRVIDISGDGASNRGRPARAISAVLAANGVTINALVIVGAKPDPVAFFTTEVIAGPGAFIETASSFDDYARAIRDKLLREITPSLATR